jgi:hypothetical protein
MKTGAGLLNQLERCGLAAKLADEHPEASEDRRDFRNVRTEIARAWATQTEAVLPDANVALGWLVSQAACVESVGEQLDLIDETTGEVLVTGRPGFVAVHADGEVLVGRWTTGDEHDAPEPEDDLGLVAMGLAASKRRSFRVATVALKDGQTFPRRSGVFEASQQPALWARIRAAVSRPRIACPGDWCGACRQAPYCPAWLARARTALVVLSEEAPLTEGPDGELQIPQLDLTTDTCSAGMARVKMIKKACELFEEQAKSFVRKGGRCVVDGKEFYTSPRAGRETADVKALKADGLEKYIHRGEGFEGWGWRKAR